MPYYHETKREKEHLPNRRTLSRGLRIVTGIAAAVVMVTSAATIFEDNLIIHHRVLCSSGALTRRMGEFGHRLLSCDIHMPEGDEIFPLIHLPQYRYEADWETEKPGGPDNVGFVLPIPACTEDGSHPTTFSDPGANFYDAAGILKASVCNCTADNTESDSQFNNTMYAIIHPDAINCDGPHGLDAMYEGYDMNYTYNRVKILEELGYWVIIWKEPIDIDDVSDPNLKDQIQTESGIKDLMKLYAYNLTTHDIVVTIDYDTIFQKPIDPLIQKLAADDTKTALYTTKPDGTVNTGMMVIKPSEEEMLAIQDVFKTSSYDTTTGWEGSGIVAPGTDGLLTYYFEQNPEKGLLDPDINDELVLSIVEHPECGLPWECHFDDAWTAAEVATCQEYANSWYSYRELFESKWYTDKPLVNTSLNDYHNEFFHGYCTSEDGYARASDNALPPSLAPTPFPCDPVKKTEEVESTLFFEGMNQTQRLRLTTPETIGSNGFDYGCISGTLEADGPEAYNILFVIDVSGSTRGGFGGERTGDVNGDKLWNTILDAEIASCIEVLWFLAHSDRWNNDNVNVGIVTFSTFAHYHGMFQPLEPTNPYYPNHSLVGFLESLVGGGWTHFDDALDKSILYFEEAPTGRKNIMYFISDGIPNVSGDDDGEIGTVEHTNNHISALQYDSELAILDSYFVERHSIGVGIGADVEPGMGLDMIDNTPDPKTGLGPVQVFNTGALINAMKLPPVVGTVVYFTIWINGVKKYGKEILEMGPLGYAFDSITEYGLDTTNGAVNTVKVDVRTDYDKNGTTLSDRNTMVIESTIIGAGA